jgi:hypothetical protein
MEKSILGRLEHFISLAKEGIQIQALIDLQKKDVIPAADPHQKPEDAKSNTMYLLIGEYSFTVAGETQKVSKVYAYGTYTYSRDSLKQNMHFANDRLKMDYKRLREAKIKFDEKFF